MMKVQDLKYWLLVPLVTRQLITFILLILSSSYTIGQSTNIEEVYYSIIKKIAYEDTIIQPSAYFVLQNGIKNGKYTEEDSLKYVSIIKNKKPAIYKTTGNNALKNTLKRELLNVDGETSIYLTQSVLKSLIHKIPKEEHLKDSYFEDIILIDQNLNKEFAHFFSSPLFIKDDEYIIYHFNHNNSLGGNAELIIARIKDGIYEIKKRIFLWVS